ncbi:Lrp/AsnC family transcriptional regulator [Aliiglaciecola sp. CAU 1673]|uniref:Lrp/AsnC family transcriptional regulator n=1 Tax=Aliiglaciecola sp. CAU 1673 TaxID=3032595 RepID=UPI0023DC7757|nr:Lrp/AsnC family transcriptional regulator [Aliiglaciecola sp. CAU 1673]MDF2180280.1 Lrp/AsnC family transcriptional regulator [Aliiglaciecola sp. CAU 1673]
MKPLDELDIKILNILYSNATIHNKALAEQVGVAPSTTLERVKKMQASNVLKTAFYELDASALGSHLEAMCAVKLNKHKEETMNTFRDEMLEIPEVINLFHMGGENDFYIHVLVSDTNHLRKFVFRALTSREEVANVETAVVFEHHKSKVLPLFNSEKK